LHQTDWAKIKIAPIIFNSHSLSSQRIPGHSFSYPPQRSLELTNNELLNTVGPIYDPFYSIRGPWQRDSKREQEMVKQSLDKLITCFHSSNEIDQRISRAVTWYSKAVDADSPEEKFVNLAIALESLLIGPEKEKNPYATTGSISQNLGERVAFLLEDDVDRRQQRVADTKKLYGLRSAIVHRGEPITLERLEDMDNLVGRVTLCFLKKDFANWEDFQKWVAQQKFENRNAPNFYNQACLFALKSKPDEALSNLRVAFELERLNNSNKYIELAKENPDLKSIRKDSRFQDLLDEFNNNPQISGSNDQE